MSECYSHHIKLGLQRGAKLELAASQTKTTWKNVRHYMCLGHSACMFDCRKGPTVTVGVRKRLSYLLEDCSCLMGIWNGVLLLLLNTKNACHLFNRNESYFSNSTQISTNYTMRTPWCNGFQKFKVHIWILFKLMEQHWILFLLHFVKKKNLWPKLCFYHAKHNAW